LTVTFVAPVIIIPDTKGGDIWATTKWVGAFWKDDQTGERIIASKVNNSTDIWSVSIDDEGDTGSWLTLEANGGYDPAIWTDNPDDAENHQLPSARVTSIPTRTGNILFRIGATSTNPADTDADYKYPDNTIGKPPRYATVTLTVNGTPYKLFCRQGEAADFVFTTSNTYTDPSTNGTLPRTLAKKFSPYNLTDALLDESGNPHQAGYQGGSFVDYPTQAGAFFQWGMNDNIIYAYHPTNPATGAVSGWSNNYYTGGYWNTIQATQETCPDGWRRPDDGSIIDVSIGNISESEMRQSLFAIPKNLYDNMNEITGNAYGYYADGYFDRRHIVASATGKANSAVSRDTKDAAYIGMLFFNSANGNYSIFFPEGGVRGSSYGKLEGASGTYWSSSAADYTHSGWYFYFFYNNSQSYIINIVADYTRDGAFSVRCVSE
jgi:hypothetical protein